MDGTPGPLVSIICFCKDRAATIRRSVESVLGQSYRHLELVVQDGASTDGTLEILRSYADPRIQLVSERDSGPAEAFWKVLNRCRGEIVGTCLSDEELLPDAVARAVDIFRREPELGAATCDGYLTDPAGNITGNFVAGEFDMVDFLFGAYCPFWPGSFFRRQALLDVGLGDETWTIGALEFEVWLRLGTRHCVKYFPIPMSKYSVDDTQLSNTPRNFHEHMDNRVKLAERMFGPDGFAGDDPEKRAAVAYNQRYLFYNNCRAYRMTGQMEAIRRQMQPAIDALSAVPWARPAFESGDASGLAPLPFPRRYYSDLAAVWRAHGQHAHAAELEERGRGEFRRRDDRIRLGYHCSFMDSDTIRFIMSDVIRRHDRSRFTVFGYSFTGVAPDIASAFDSLRVTRDLSDGQFAELVRADGIDILIEMSGYSPFHRFGAMARRCAPVQINYINHSGTSGVEEVDYLLTDAVSVPPEHDRFYTETVWRLPGCFLNYNYDMVRLPEVVPPPSLTNGYVTFGCFGSGSKINDALIAIWARVMRRVAGSRMYIRNAELTPPDNQTFMRERFARHGIAPERIQLDGRGTRDEVVRSYGQVDISLDTWPYCGGNTVAESLWQGVPVITLQGTRFSSRYGASLLLACGCPELIGGGDEAYVEIAAALAGAPDRLRYYRDNLRPMAREFGMSDPPRFVRKLEEAYLAMSAEAVPA
jgi:glycosyltransferase involved in cell wall biosynthesis